MVLMYFGKRMLKVIQDIWKTAMFMILTNKQNEMPLVIVIEMLYQLKYKILWEKMYVPTARVVTSSLTL